MANTSNRTLRLLSLLQTLDAIWLAKLAERGMLRPSFVPPKPIRELRDLTRARDRCATTWSTRPSSAT